MKTQKEISQLLNTSKPKLKSILKHTFETEDFADVTLVCDDQIQIPAHKLVLSSHSPFLKNLLLDTSELHPVVHLVGVSHQDLICLLRLMYLGEVTFNKARFKDISKVALEFNAHILVRNEDTRIYDVEKELDTNEFVEEKCKEIQITKTSKENATVDKADLVPSTHIPVMNENKIQQDFICKKCGLGFKRRYNLLRHKKSKHYCLEYHCNLCEYRSKREDTLKIHKESEHEGITYPCNQCDHKSKRVIGLKDHIESVHEGVQYLCNQCQYQTSDKGSLGRHKRTKHEGRRYFCEHCAVHTTTMANLRVHRQAVHEGIRYFCDQCEFTASQSNNLRVHKLRKHFQ